VPARRLAATLNNEVAIFMRNEQGMPPAAIKTAKHLFVIGGGEVNHPNQTILAERIGLRQWRRLAKLCINRRKLSRTLVLSFISIQHPCLDLQKR
jgi:hypothetical protein